MNLELTDGEATALANGTIPRTVQQRVSGQLLGPVPNKLGALVRDRNGDYWVRTAAHMASCNDWVRLTPGSGGVARSETGLVTRKSYADIGVVEHLFEGV